MIQGFERAQAEYESRMYDPYGYEDEYDEDAYYNHVDWQMDNYLSED